MANSPQISTFQPTLEMQALLTQTEPLIVGDRPKQDISGWNSPEPDKNDTPQYQVFNFTLGALGTVQTFNTDAGLPDYWLIYLLPTANASKAALYIYLGPGVSGGGVAIGGGGIARLPGISDYITIRTSLGDGTGYGGIIACRRWRDIIVWPGSA